MPDSLYRSYSLEKSLDDGQIISSGNLTLWEDEPVSPLSVGDSFRPVPDGPTLKVKKVNISDNVIGIVAGKTVRQWQISIEGDNKSDAPSDPSSDDTHTLYNFSFNDDETSGTMEVTNTGNAPTLSLDIGGTFSIPGLTDLFTVTEVRGNDSYDENDLHTWKVTYEGKVNPGDSSQGDNPLPETKYSLTIDKDSDGLIQKSGSKITVQEADSPAIDIQVGSKFSIPGIGKVTCSKVTGSDDYTDSGVHRWTMTYEGYINEQSSDDEPQSSENPDSKFSFYVEKNSDGELVHSGSVEISSICDNPPSAYQVGSSMNLPGIGEVTCTKVSGSDSYTENGHRKWVMVYEGSDSVSDAGSSGNTSHSVEKYSFSIEENSNGELVYSGSKDISYPAQNSGVTPSPGVNIGSSVRFPVVGTLPCTKINGSQDDNGAWSFSIECSNENKDFELPEDELSTSYELNGITARSVTGEFIALMKSETHITKKTITIYNRSEASLAALGSTYEDGIALSETIVKETIKKGNNDSKTYYKHTIEVEV